jgi:hypothetical protein
MSVKALLSCPCVNGDGITFLAAGCERGFTGTRAFAGCGQLDGQGQPVGAFQIQ